MQLRSIPVRYQTPAAALFVLLLGAAWLTAWGWRYEAREAVVENELHRGIAIGTSLINVLLPKYRGELLGSSSQLSPDVISAIHNSIQTQLKDQNISQAMIVRRAGRVVYALDKSHVPAGLGDDPGVQRALNGQAGAGILPVNDHSLEPGGQTLVRIYIPIRPGVHEHQEGVLVLHSPVSAAMERVQADARNVWALANLAGLCVFGIGLMILRKAEERQRRQDAVTGLPGRDLAVRTLDQLRGSPGPIGQRCGWAAIGVRRMREISAAYGHRAAEEMLRGLVKNLTEVEPGVGQLFRISGETIALMLIDDQRSLSDAQRCEQVANKLFAKIAGHLNCEGQSIVPEVSVGFALSRESLLSAEILLNRAEVSLTEAREAGAGRWVQYTPGLELGVRDRLQLVGGIRQALERHEFLVHYQPIISAADRRIVGCEALVRWAHPKRGLVAPDNFIPLLEESGLIVEVGLHVLLVSCRQAAKWRREIASDFSIAVNFSARQFAEPDLLTQIKKILVDAGLPPNALVVEVTESFLAREPDHTATVLRDMRALGIQIAIDDFGVGYSSLSALKNMPVDILKIDRSFILLAPLDPVDASIAKAVAALARGLQLTLVAEGVETEAQAEFARSIGCDKLQGFLYSKALDADTFEASYGSKDG